ncbi:hypothetical protein V6N11_043594 [Hibiscus sabdariffa]|uniref:Cystathionine gamma-synthase n=1 Tax=Hibiscus sabdariffa TaxID=183260 RepID=A0ABR2RCP5_9ROSI
MAVSSCSFTPRVFSAYPPSFDCRPDPDFSGAPIGDKPRVASSRRVTASSLYAGGISSRGLSSLIFRFPPNFVRQLSIKARRNCSNIGVAQIVAASWSNGQASDTPPSMAAASAQAAAAAVTATVNDDVAAVEGCIDNRSVQIGGSDNSTAAFLSSDGSITVHAGERLGRGIVTDAITTPVVNTSAYFFKKTQELIDFKEKRHKSFEYGRYGNPTTVVAEEKISALEGAESTLIMASGMCASTVMLMALVPAGGHMVTTTDCYRKTRIFIENFLPKMGISVTVIDPADVDGLETALNKNKVSLFFTESPTNPFLRCVDIEKVSNLCHSKGALVCIDGTFATPLNQKALALGADLVLHSATKFIGGHNDVLAGCISGSEKLVTEIRTLHHVLGGTLNPNAAYLIIRGMKTLHLRVQQQNLTALRMAEVLEAHPRVRRVYYPGLPSHPEHEIAKKQMTGFGGVVSFEVDGDLMTTIKFVDALKIPYIAPSFGGCESIVDQPAIMSYWDLSQAERRKYGIEDNLVRFSFGVEGFEDLKADILQALDKSTSSSLLESFRFPKLSLISKTVDSEQDRAGYSSTSQVPPPLSSEFKFPAKLLVYQRRPKVLLPNQQAELSSMSNQHQQAESFSCQHSESLSQQQAGNSSLFNQQQTDSSFLPIQQAAFCFHQGSSTGFSQTSNSPDDVPQSSATSLSGSGSQVFNLLDDSNDKLAKTQECSARESSNSQGASEVSESLTCVLLLLRIPSRVALLMYAECASVSTVHGRWHCKYSQNMFMRENCVEHNVNAVAAARILGVDSIEQITSRCIRFVKIIESEQSLVDVLYAG